MGLWDKLNAKGITLRQQRLGEHQTTCPECSEQRKPMNRKKPCLSVKVEADKAVYCCHHCGWKGAVFSEDNMDKKNAGNTLNGARGSAGRAGAGPRTGGKAGPVDAARKKRWW